VSVSDGSQRVLTAVAVPKVSRNRGYPERCFGGYLVVDYCHSAAVHTLILFQVHCLQLM